MSQQPEPLGQEDELSSHQCNTYLETGGWHRVRGRSDTAMVLQISSMHAEISRLNAENDALKLQLVKAKVPPMTERAWAEYCLAYRTVDATDPFGEKVRGACHGAAP